MEKYYTTKEKGHLHDTTMPLLVAMYSEFKELSKKKFDAAVNKSKIKISNRLLEKVRQVLENTREIEFLDLIDEDDVPQVSDVTLILSQYVAAMESYREFHYGWNGSEQDWFIKN